jgi:hypothetical protein
MGGVRMRPKEAVMSRKLAGRGGVDVWKGIGGWKRDRRNAT